MIKHIENDQARVDLDTGGYLLIEPDANTVQYGGDDYPLSDDHARAAHYRIKGMLYSADDIISKVIQQWDAALAEQSQAEADEADHIERYSSVEGSGRI